MKCHVSVMNSMIDKLFKGVEFLAGGLLGIVAILVGAQVVARYLIGFSFPWAEELPILMFAWIAFLGASVALQKNEHLSVQLFTKTLKPRMQKILNLCTYILSVVFILLIVLNGTSFVYTLRNISFITINISKSWFYFSLVVGGLLMLISLFGKITTLIIHWREK